MRRCEAAVEGVCTSVAQHRHHIKLRSAGGTNDPSNLLDVCLRCHDHIHRNPAWAMAHGFIRSRYAS